MKYLMFVLTFVATGSTAFGGQYSFPPELAKAEVCSISGTYALNCVDADGIEILHEVSLHKISGFFDSEPKYNRLSTIVMMRKQGFELRSSMSNTGSASDLFFVRAR